MCTHTRMHTHTNEIIPLTLCFSLPIIIQKRKEAFFPILKGKIFRRKCFFLLRRSWGEFDKAFDLYVS